MSVLARLFNKKHNTHEPQDVAGQPLPGREAASAPADTPPAPTAPAEAAAPRPLAVTQETLGLSDEVPKTRLPEHAPVTRLDVLPAEEEAELKELQRYRQTPGYRNFMDKAKRPPIDGPRRLNIPEEYGGPPQRRRP
jgi:hypothetical protein